MTIDCNKPAEHLHTTRKPTGHNLPKTHITIPTNIQTAKRNFTNIILMADKHNISMGKMRSNCRLLPDHILCKITQRNNMRRENTCDPALKLLSEEITPDINKHKQNIWKEHLHAHWDHRNNTHILSKTNHGLYKREPPTIHTQYFHSIKEKVTTTPKTITICYPNNSQTCNTQDKQIH